MDIKKYFYFNNSNSNITLGMYYYPMFEIGMEFTGEGLKFQAGFLLHFYIVFDIKYWNKWFYEHKLYHKALQLTIYFTSGWLACLNLMSDTMGHKRGDWNWSVNLWDKIRGPYTVTKKVVLEKDITIPMPEKAYPAHAILADWTWTYPRWFAQTVRRCEIDIPEGIPHEGKGENSWDCGQDATFGITTGKIRNIEEAVGNLVGNVLHDRVRYGGWDDWSWTKPPESSGGGEPKQGATEESSTTPKNG